MVHRCLRWNLILVLFSVCDQRWKIADFRCTAEGTPKRLMTTTSRRGTSRYQAPEILSDNAYGHYNTKTDIWAFGCIVYELCTKQPEFRTILKPRSMNRVIIEQER